MGSPRDSQGSAIHVFLVYISLCGFHTRCLYWVSRWPSPRSNYSASLPMKLMTSQTLPPRSASSVMIMSHSIDLAGLAHRKNSLTLRCFLTWKSSQSGKISPPYLPGFHTKQGSHPPTDRLVLGSLLTPSKTASPLVFSGYIGLNTRDARFKRKLSGHLSFSKITQIYIFQKISN